MTKKELQDRLDEVVGLCAQLTENLVLLEERLSAVEAAHNLHVSISCATCGVHIAGPFPAANDSLGRHAADLTEAHIKRPLAEGEAHDIHKMLQVVHDG